MVKSLTLIAFVLMLAFVSFGQDNEPGFIGEAYVLKTDGTHSPLDKEIGDFTSGVSWTHNSWNAMSLEVVGGTAQSRFKSNEPVNLIVRAVDNNSDPLTIISIYKFKAKSKSRSVLLGKDNSGTWLKSRTNSKDLIRFSGRKYATSSYLIALKDLPPGEYGIIVSNPNNRDEKRVVVSCFGID
jgi:hypothetical protein